MRIETKYFSDDGKEFETRQEAQDYELGLKLKENGLSGFSKSELTIGNGVDIVDHLPFEAPWLGAMGACMVKIFEIKRDDKGSVLFGVGNEEPPVVAWVSANDFFDETTLRY